MIQRKSNLQLGDNYRDVPVVLMPKRMDVNVRSAFNSVSEQKLPIPQQAHIGYRREYLRWMRPDGNGGMIPR